MADTVKVRFSIEGKWRVGGTTELSRKLYDALTKKLDANPRGYAREQLAEEVMEALNIDLRSGDIDDFDVEDFHEAAK